MQPMSFRELKAARQSRRGPSSVPDRSSRDVRSGSAVETGSSGEFSGSKSTCCSNGLEDLRLQDASSPDRGQAMHEDPKTNESLRLKEYGVKVCRVPGRGRGLFAESRSHQPGDQIFGKLKRPIASALTASKLASHCSYCYLSAQDSAAANLREQKNMLRCGGCRIVHYCSSACAKADWPAHSPECKALKRAREVPSDWTRALGRLVWAETAHRAAHTNHSPEWDEYQIMQSHPNTSEGKRREIKELAARLKSYLGVIDIALTELEGLISKLQTNSFTLASPDLTPLGILLSPHCAMANHSCDPNAAVVFPNGAGKPVMVALREIQPDEEILNSYVDLSAPTSMRQAELEKTYAFTCSCAKCTASSASSQSLESNPPDPRWCLLHIGCKARGRLALPQAVRPDSVPMLAKALQSSLGWNPKKVATCSGCGEHVEVDLSDFVKVCSRAMEVVKLDMQGQLDTATGLSIVPDLMAKLLNLMPPSSHPLLHLLRALFLLLLPPDDLPSMLSAVQAISLAHAGASEVYPAHFPSLAIIKAEWAKATFHLATGEWETTGQQAVTLTTRYQWLTQATKLLQEAAVACELGFGRATGGGLVGREMRSLLQRCQVEEAGLRTEMDLVCRSA